MSAGFKSPLFIFGLSSVPSTLVVGFKSQLFLLGLSIPQFTAPTVAKINGVTVDAIITIG